MYYRTLHTLNPTPVNVFNAWDILVKGLSQGRGESLAEDLIPRCGPTVAMEIFVCTSFIIYETTFNLKAKLVLQLKYP